MYIAIIIGVVILLVLAVAAIKSNSFRTERSISINASPDRIFPLINDFHQWTVWSPWEQVDADLKRTYAGPPSGKGAIYEWAGKKTGAGRMEVTDSTPPNRVIIKLDFLKPFEAHNIADFAMESRGNTTNVTWAMYGDRPFVAKVMDVFMSLDKMVGKDFERGLTNLKAASER